MIKILMISLITTMRRSASFTTSHALFRSQSRLLSSSSSVDDSIKQRRQLVLTELEQLTLTSPELLEERDPRPAHEAFGKSAVRTYNTFIIKGGNESSNFETLAAAKRTALQIDFLAKRHVAAISSTLRNTDTFLSSSSSSSSAFTSASPIPVTLVLDNLRSASNVGALLRSSDACGIQSGIPIGITPSPTSIGREAVLKASLGAEEFVDTSKRFDRLEDAAKSLKADNFKVYALETHESAKSIYDADLNFDDKTAIIVGNEVTGISEKFLNDKSLCDGVIEVPMFGLKNSLNVAVAGSIVMSEVSSKMRKLRGGCAHNNNNNDKNDWHDYRIDGQKDWVSAAFDSDPMLQALPEFNPHNARSKPKVLLLYGSLRETSYSKFLIFECARLLERMGCEIRVFNPVGLPVRQSPLHDEHSKVIEIRELSNWSDGQVWCSPELHGCVTGAFKNQIDWLPLNSGSVRPTQGRSLAVLQVNGGSQSFNVVNELRRLGRWMRMNCSCNQSSVPMAWKEFDEEGRMKESSYRHRVVDVMEEFYKFTRVNLSTVRCTRSATARGRRRARMRGFSKLRPRKRLRRIN